MTSLLKHLGILSLAFACLLVVPSWSNKNQVSDKQRNPVDLNRNDILVSDEAKNLNKEEKERIFNRRINRKKKQRNKKEKKIEKIYKKTHGNTSQKGPCDGTLADWSCCSKSNPCQEQQGDCDRDSHCASSLVCGKDNCRYFNREAHSLADCCINPAGSTEAKDSLAEKCAIYIRSSHTNTTYILISFSSNYSPANQPNEGCIYMRYDDFSKTNGEEIQILTYRFYEIINPTVCSHMNGAFCQSYGEESSIGNIPENGTCSKDCKEIADCSSNPEDDWCRCTIPVQTSQTVNNSRNEVISRSSTSQTEINLTEKIARDQQCQTGMPAAESTRLTTNQLSFNHWIPFLYGIPICSATNLKAPGACKIWFTKCWKTFIYKFVCSRIGK